MPFTCEMLIKIETNLKLNLIDTQGRSFIPESEWTDDEIHYLKFESLVQNFDVSIRQVLKLLKTFIREPELEFQEWTIIDLDNHLKGNPHCEE